MAEKLTRRQVMEWRRWARSAQERIARKRIIVEGIHPLLEALATGTTPIAIVARDEAILHALPPSLAPVYIDAQAVQRIATTNTPPPVVAILPMPQYQLPVSAKTAILLDGIQHPGNAGSIIRTAYWFGLDAVILWGGIDPWHPRCISGSAGAVFRMPVVRMNSWSLLKQWLANQHMEVWTAEMKGEPLESLKPSLPWMLVVGSEGQGIDVKWHQLGARSVQVTGCRNFESLNVAVAAGIILYQWTPRIG